MTSIASSPTATTSSWSAAAAWRNRATGKVVDSPKVDIWHFENGRITQFLEMFDSHGFVRALGAV